MKYNSIKLLAIIILFSFGCNKTENKGNIFKDEAIKEIFTFQDSRDGAGLLSYFKNEQPEYRKYAALAFASIQDKEAVDELILLLGDEDESVRGAAAYSLGQTGDISAEKGLITNFRSERSDEVKKVILESLGKCGGDRALEFLNDPALSKGNQIVMKGQALGIYRAVLKKKHSKKGLETIVKVLLKSDSTDVRFYASNALSRIRDVDLTDYFEDLRNLIRSEKEVRTKMNLILALGKCKGDEVAGFLKAFLSEDNDEKIVVNSIRALGKFDYKDISEDLLRLASSRNYQISVTASEVLLNIGSTKDINVYLKLAGITSNWRVGANLFRLSLRLSDKKGSISSLIMAHYKKSIDPYQKGLLLIALSESPENYPFVEAETFREVHKSVSTSGMISISEMMSKKGFNPEVVISSGKGSFSLRKVFADIFVRGISSGDSSLISISSSALRDPKYKFREVITDLTFLEDLQKEEQSMAKSGSRNEINKTLNFFRGIKGEREEEPAQKKTLNWDKVVSIPSDQKIKIVTDEGDIIIRLYVNKSPGSVSNFLDLINSGYLAESAFHRVVPNFVVQDGCPRGDGWGGPDKIIRSEFSFSYYEEGSLGMASSGKDTEGSQWFITHSSTPHLDGRYTIFGKVVEGMEIVNKTRVGTRILKYMIL